VGRPKNFKKGAAWTVSAELQKMLKDFRARAELLVKDEIYSDGTMIKLEPEI
jgi:hypothetical protein